LKRPIAPVERVRYALDVVQQRREVEGERREREKLIRAKKKMWSRVVGTFNTEESRIRRSRWRGTALKRTGGKNERDGRTMRRSRSRRRRKIAGKGETVVCFFPVTPFAPSSQFEA
jgi:hypothetical protein